MNAGKVRLDRLLVERGLAETRQKAQAMILAGEILVEDQKAEKCGTSVKQDVAVRFLGEPQKYVGRGGLKLEEALDFFNIEVRDTLCLDVGASTGGFTDCLLQRGARRVIAVDAGTNQLDWRLRQNPRVVSLEKTNARYLSLEQVGEKADVATMDVSFISATLIAPQLPPLLRAGAHLLVLVKPQFEVGRGQVGKGGVVKDEALHRQAVAKVQAKLEELGFDRIGSMECSLRGMGGNREFFLHALWRNAPDSAIFASR